MNTDRRSSGNPAFDRLLGGGLESRTICQIYGGPASGKSTLCTIAAVASLRAGRAVVFIDSEGFSIERFRQIAGSDTDSIADRLFLFEPIDFEQQGSMIAEADKILKADKTGLLVMDSATALYRTDLEKGRDAMQMLTRQMIHLLGYAKRYDIPVMVTNQVYMDTVKNTYAGLGGTSLEHISKSIVRLDRLDAPGMRRATLIKHRSRPEGASFDFEIVEDGIRTTG
jgi:DNA repair protein RadB